MPRRALSDEIKTFIVQQLAAWDPPSLVATLVYERYGLRITRQNVQRYDPEKSAGSALSPKLTELFRATRQAFIADEAQVGIAHRTVRLRRLDRAQLKAEALGALKLVGELGEIAAKERGDAYTNARIFRGALSVTAPRSLADFYAGISPEADETDGSALREEG